MLAVIDYNGTQIKVEEQKEYNIPFSDTKAGEHLNFDKVILVIDGDTTKVGTPYLEDTSIEAEVVGSINSPKISVIKFHPKKRYQRIGSHRSDFTRVKILKISTKK